MKIAILGGTFNPIHNGHLLIAEEVKDEFNLDKILFIPNKKPPHKSVKNSILDRQRIEMINLAISNNSYFKLDTREIDRGGVSFTIDTVKEIISDTDIDGKIRLIIGGDLLPELNLWKNIDELSKIVQFVVLNRGNEIANEYKDKYPFIKTLKNTVNFGVTSSLIREKVKNKQSISYLVPDSVRDYIYKEKIYVE